MVRCVVLDDYQGVARSMADWSLLPDDVEVSILREHVADPAALIQGLQGVEIVVAMRERTPFPAEVLAALPSLRLLVTTGMKNASIDLDAARRQGITVCGTNGSGGATVELTWALILGLARSIVTEANGLRDNGPWQATVGTGLEGQTLGVIGLGRLGTQVAKVGQAFGMDVCAWSPNLTSDRAAAANVRFVPSLAELMRESDVATIHLVLGPTTRGLVDAAALSELRPTALLVNTSRGPIVDEDALIAALVTNRIAGAALDVYGQEPLPADHPFRTLPNVLATPHLGYVTRASYEIYFRNAVEDIAAFLAGSPVRLVS